jgi:hypothetical protein
VAAWRRRGNGERNNIRKWHRINNAAISRNIIGGSNKQA